MGAVSITGVTAGDADGEMIVKYTVCDGGVSEVRLCASVAGTGGFTATAVKVS